MKCGKKFNLKSLRVTKSEGVIICVILCAISIIHLLMPIETMKGEQRQNNLDIKIDAEGIADFVSSFNFGGKITHQIVFENQYINVVYENNTQQKSHFILANRNEEVEFKDFIKDSAEAQFDAKERELLQLKFPSKIVNILNQASKTYVFYDDYLYVSYDVTNLLNTTRQFDLKLFYADIHEFLEFHPIVNGNVTRENGFVYDKNKVSIAFTFDDGPNGKKTQALIDLLEDYKMSATFFMVGNKLNGGSETVKKVYNSHSEIGYHSYKHSYLTKQTPEEIKSEFNTSNSILKSITGSTFKYTRPPYGAYNKTVLNSIESVFVGWSLDTNDWRYKDSTYIKNYVLNNIEDGEIILLHDSYQTTIDAVTELVDTLYLMDIQVVNVSELARLKEQKLEINKIYKHFK